MKLTDNIRLSFLVLFREKKKFIYNSILLLFVIISLALFVYKYNTSKMIEYSVTNNTGFNTLVVVPRYKDDDITNSDGISKIIKKDMEELMKLEHVIDVYKPDYYDFVTTSNFANDFLDGTITLIRGNKQTLPPVIAGQTFDRNDSGVAICPKDFYPNFEPRKINKKYVINGYEMLDKEFNITYGDYDGSGNYNKSFKIVGIYNSFERFNDNGTCYISEKDIQEIVDQENEKETESNPMVIMGIPNLYVVVDNKDNINDVKLQMQELNFDNINIASMINTEMVNTIYISFISFFIIILISITIIMPFYTKWRLKGEEKNIGVLRVCGYSEKDVRNVYILKLLLQYIFIYFIGIIIFLICFMLIKSNIQIFIDFDYMLGGLKIKFSSIILTLLLNVLLPIMIMIPYLYKICSNQIINLTKEKE